MKESEIIHKGNLILKNTSPKKIDNDTLKKISKIWKSEFKKNNERLFNDKVLSFDRIFKNNNATIVEGSYVDYKTVLVDRKEPKLNLKINQIGVSGMTLIQENNNLNVLFSIRSSIITEYPGFIELVPSGNLDQSVLEDDGTINYKSKLIEEFEEETGLNRSSINKVSTLGLVRDNINHVYDVCCLLILNTSSEELTSSFEKVSEYKVPQLVNVKDLKKFSTNNSNKIVPTSKAIIECYFHQIDV